MYLIDNDLGGTTPLDIILKFKNDDQIIDTTIKAEEEDDLEEEKEEQEREREGDYSGENIGDDVEEALLRRHSNI